MGVWGAIKDATGISAIEDGVSFVANATGISDIPVVGDVGKFIAGGGLVGHVFGDDKNTDIDYVPPVSFVTSRAMFPKDEEEVFGEDYYYEFERITPRNKILPNLTVPILKYDKEVIEFTNLAINGQHKDMILDQVTKDQKSTSVKMKFMYENFFTVNEGDTFNHMVCVPYITLNRSIEVRASQNIPPHKTKSNLPMFFKAKLTNKFDRSVKITDMYFMYNYRTGKYQCVRLDEANQQIKSFHLKDIYIPGSYTTILLIEETTDYIEQPEFSIQHTGYDINTDKSSYVLRTKNDDVFFYYKDSRTGKVRLMFTKIPTGDYSSSTIPVGSEWIFDVEDVVCGVNWDVMRRRIYYPYFYFHNIIDFSMFILQKSKSILSDSGNNYMAMTLANHIDPHKFIVEPVVYNVSDKSKSFNPFFPNMREYTIGKVYINDLRQKEMAASYGGAYYCNYANKRTPMSYYDFSTYDEISNNLRHHACGDAIEIHDEDVYNEDLLEDEEFIIESFEDGEKDEEPDDVKYERMAKEAKTVYRVAHARAVGDILFKNTVIVTSNGLFLEKRGNNEFLNWTEGPGIIEKPTEFMFDVENCLLDINSDFMVSKLKIINSDQWVVYNNGMMEIVDCNTRASQFYIKARPNLPEELDPQPVIPAYLLNTLVNISLPGIGSDRAYMCIASQSPGTSGKICNSRSVSSLNGDKKISDRFVGMTLESKCSSNEIGFEIIRHVNEDKYAIKKYKDFIDQEVPDKFVGINETNYNEIVFIDRPVWFNAEKVIKSTKGKERDEILFKFYIVSDAGVKKYLSVRSEDRIMDMYEEGIYMPTTPAAMIKFSEIPALSTLVPTMALIENEREQYGEEWELIACNFKKEVQVRNEQNMYQEKVDVFAAKGFDKDSMKSYDVDIFVENKEGDGYKKITNSSQYIKVFVRNFYEQLDQSIVLDFLKKCFDPEERKLGHGVPSVSRIVKKQNIEGFESEAEGDDITDIGKEAVSTSAKNVDVLHSKGAVNWRKIFNLEGIFAIQDCALNEIKTDPKLVNIRHEKSMWIKRTPVTKKDKYIYYVGEEIETLKEVYVPDEAVSLKGNADTDFLNTCKDKAIGYNELLTEESKSLPYEEIVEQMCNGIVVVKKENTTDALQIRKTYTYEATFYKRFEQKKDGLGKRPRRDGGASSSPFDFLDNVDFDDGEEDIGAKSGAKPGTEKDKVEVEDGDGNIIERIEHNNANFVIERIHLVSKEDDLQRYVDKTVDKAMFNSMTVSELLIYYLRKYIKLVVFGITLMAVYLQHFVLKSSATKSIIKVCAIFLTILTVEKTMNVDTTNFFAFITFINKLPKKRKKDPLKSSSVKEEIPNSDKIKEKPLLLLPDT